LARYCHECGTALHNDSRPNPVVRVDTTQTKKKKTRKVSAYSRRYGVEYKRLKAKHPRMKFGALSKKAHAATRKAMK